MAQQMQRSRRPDAETAWLSALVTTMESVSRAGRGRVPHEDVASVQAQLRRPAMPNGFYGSVFSFRN
jgi:hypothetical protein